MHAIEVDKMKHKKVATSRSKSKSHIILILAVIIIGLFCISLFSSDVSPNHIGEIEIPASARKMAGANYNEVIADLRESGFTNIDTEEIADLITGWMKREGEVEEVLIGGTDDYSSGDWVLADTDVLVRYHVFEESSTEDFLTNGTVM